MPKPAKEYTTVNVQNDVYDRAKIAAAVRGKSMTEAATEAFTLWIGDAKDVAAKAANILRSKPPVVKT